MKVGDIIEPNINNIEYGMKLSYKITQIGMGRAFIQDMENGKVLEISKSDMEYYYSKKKDSRERV